MSFLSAIATPHNRAKTIRPTLDRMSDQPLPKDHYEVIVMDDESPDDTKRLVREYITQTNLGIRHYRQANRGPG